MAPRPLLPLVLLLGACHREGAPPPPSPPPPTPRDLSTAPVPPDLAPPVSLAIPPDATKCPDDMAPIPIGGCIDKWEASAAPGGALGSPDGRKTTVVAQSAPGRPPLSRVTRAQAERACRNAKKRLCTEAEWVSACRGPAKWQYPYGPAFEPRRCIDWDASDNGKKGAAPTGSAPRCVTPWGVFDLANNVGEWVAASEEDRSGFAEIRGGTYNMTVIDSACDSDDYRVRPTVQTPDVGFRCCRDAPKR